MESFQTDWKVSGQPGKVLNGQESFQTVLKVSGTSEKFPDGLESFSVGPESFQIVWNFS